MKSRPKLSGSPLGYTLTKVEGTADTFSAFSEALWSTDGAVSQRVKELVFTRTSIINQCPTCLSSHVVSARQRGVSEAQIEALDDPSHWSDVFDEREILVLRLTDAASTASHQLDDELVNSLRAHFTELERAELALVVGHAHLCNRVGNVARQILGP